VAKEGLTISGGEPTLQSAAVSIVIDEARKERDLHVMLYTGYRLEWLRSKGSEAQRALLDRVDLLVDGPYVERLHRRLKWRGSTNQRLLDLSGRGGVPSDDEPAGIDLDLDLSRTHDTGSRQHVDIAVTGVPDQPGLRAWLDSLRHDDGCSGDDVT
jgi:anaerobic ribonucleoside-triphosphate reductase activating protein